MARFRSCPSCRGRGKLEITVKCPECEGEGSITARQVVGRLGDLLSPEVLDQVAVMLTEAEGSDATSSTTR